MRYCPVITMFYPGHASFDCGICDRFCNSRAYLIIKNRWYDAVMIQFIGTNQVRQGLNSSLFHLLIDVRCLYVECAPKHAREN